MAKTQYSFSDSNDLSAVATTACSESDVVYIPTDNTAATYAELIGNISLDTLAKALEVLATGPSQDAMQIPGKVIGDDGCHVVCA